MNHTIQLSHNLSEIVIKLKPHTQTDYQIARLQCCWQAMSGSIANSDRQTVVVQRLKIKNIPSHGMRRYCSCCNFIRPKLHRTRWKKTHLNGSCLLKCILEL